jgi:hypothetical protein
MTRLRSLIKEVLSTPPKKKDCNCGCGGCGKKAPVLTENKVKSTISEGLQYHIDKKVPLHESVYRIGSEKHFALINEVRALWVRELINVSEDDQALLETHLGNFGMYEGEKVPLDMPMVNEDIYDKFLDDPQNPKGRAKAIISKFIKQYGEDASGMAVDRFAKQNNLKPEEKYILQYITKNDISISSKPGGPDFSALGEAKKKAKSKKKDPPLNKPKRGGSKAYYVYVRDPKTKKIKKVSFGSGGLRAKIKNKQARNAFAARHNCKNKKDRTKAGYWSCNLPRYAEQLGLGSKMNTFW